jgi:hypothetical protein
MSKKGPFEGILRAFWIFMNGMAQGPFDPSLPLLITRRSFWQNPSSSPKANVRGFLSFYKGFSSFEYISIS